MVLLCKKNSVKQIKISWWIIIHFETKFWKIHRLKWRIVWIVNVNFSCFDWAKNFSNVFSILQWKSVLYTTKQKTKKKQRKKIGDSNGLKHHYLVILLLNSPTWINIFNLIEMLAWQIRTQIYVLLLNNNHKYAKHIQARLIFMFDYYEATASFGPKFSTKLNFFLGRWAKFLEVVFFKRLKSIIFLLVKLDTFNLYG